MQATEKPTTGDPPPAFDFTEESVRALLLEHAFRKHGPTSWLNMPNAEETEHLMIMLNACQWMFRENTENSKNVDPLIARLELAINELEDILPKLIDAFHKHPNFNNPLFLNSPPPLKALYEAIPSGLAKSFLLLRWGGERRNCWRDFAPEIAKYFRDAMRSANPGTDLGLSNDGPVPRFVAAVLPLVTGDTPTVANVAKCLKDKARKAATRDKPKS